jgi:thiol-disulfide isomerase/thioredoxin
MAKKVKREVIEWGIFLTVIVGLYLSGWHTEVIGTLQRAVLVTGIMQPDLDDKARPADYNLVLVDMDGNNINVKDWKGEPIFINLWATWCPPCVAEMPDINNLYNKVENEVKFAIISVDQDRDKARAFAKRKDFDFPIYFLKGALPSAYQTRSIPTTYVISPEGQIVVTNKGMAKYSTDKFVNFLRSL